MDQATATGQQQEQPEAEQQTQTEDVTAWIPDPVRRARAEDVSYLDTLTWQRGRCAVCKVDQELTTEFDHIEQGTLTGWSLRICYRHAAYDLTLSRAEAHARGEDFVPDIRRRS